jgi:hypothetical protein
MCASSEKQMHARSDRRPDLRKRRTSRVSPHPTRVRFCPGNPGPYRTRIARFPLELWPLHTPSSKRAPLAKLGLTAERSRPQHDDSFEVAAGQDCPLRTDGLAASVAASRTS